MSMLAVGSKIMLAIKLTSASLCQVKFIMGDITIQFMIQLLDVFSSNMDPFQKILF